MIQCHSDIASCLAITNYNYTADIDKVLSISPSKSYLKVRAIRFSLSRCLYDNANAGVGQSEELLKTGWRSAVADWQLICDWQGQPLSHLSGQWAESCFLAVSPLLLTRLSLSHVALKPTSHLNVFIILLVLWVLAWLNAYIFKYNPVSGQAGSQDRGEYWQPPIRRLHCLISVW